MVYDSLQREHNRNQVSIMDFQWMEEIPWLRKIKDWIKVRNISGNILFWIPRTGLVSDVKGRKPGISVYMFVKNEALWIEPTLRSLEPFVEQFSIVDNGSTDDTVAIIKRVADELSLDYVLISLPDADFGEVQDQALKNTTCKWVLRWAGDIIARTQGNDTFRKIRDFALSLDQRYYYAIHFPHIQLDGDLFHQDPERPIHYEDYLTTFSHAMYHSRSGRFRELRYPFYYKRIYLWNPTSYHIWGLDEPKIMIQRKYWEPWRKLNDPETYPTLESYALSRIREDYGTGSLEEAGALYCRERFKKLVKYDEEKYGEYPELLKPFLDTFPLRLVCRGGKIAGRSDFIGLLDRLDRQKKKTSVDVIIPTRGRRDMPVTTVEKLLEDNYPDYRIIVIDQNDTPIEKLREMSESHTNLIHHAAESRGLPAGRNEGLGLSESEIVIYVDDDIIPEPDFIKGHVLAYTHESVGGIAGKVLEVRPEMSKHVPPGKVGKVNYWSGELYRGFTGDNPVDIDSAQGVNMSFRREVLEEIGGFDTRYGGTFFYEETDTCLRVRKLGYKMRYTPDAVLTHLGVPAGGCRIEDIEKQVYWYGHNFSLLFLKHFPRYTFPVWFAVRCAKFIRDVVRTGSITPFVKGFTGMYHGWRSYRIKNCEL